MEEAGGKASAIEMSCLVRDLWNLDWEGYVLNINLLLKKLIGSYSFYFKSTEHDLD